MSKKQMELSLKANLKEKCEQAEWFRTFLAQVTDEAISIGAIDDIEDLEDSSIASPQSAQGVSSAFDSVSSAGNSGLAQDAESRTLVNNARRRWKGIIRDLGRSELTTSTLREDSDALERECQAHRSVASELSKAIRTMESDVRGHHNAEVARDQLVARNRTLKEELAGLNQRMASLEAPSRQSSPGSWLSRSFPASNASSPSVGTASFQMSTAARESTERQTCVNRTREGSCNVM